MPFEGLGQALYDDCKKIALLEVFIELVETGHCTQEDAIAKLHISQDDFDIAASKIKLFDKRDKNIDYQRIKEFRSKHQDILGKMNNCKRLF